jgi:hypothetical protein
MVYTASLKLGSTKILDPRLDPSFTFTCFVPGKPMAKGSTETGFMKRNGRTVQVKVDREPVRDWVAAVAAAAILERQLPRAKGDDPFPYEGPVTLKALFVFPRPPSQPVGPPVTCKGLYAVGDLDKLVRAIGDALPPGSVSVGKSGSRKAPLAGVILDDRLITEISARKAFVDEPWLPMTETDPPRPGCYFTLTAANSSRM